METTMLAMVLCEGRDVRTARDCAVALARAAGLPDPEQVAMAVGELGTDCLEQREGPGVAILRIGCGRGKVIVEAENPCRGRAPWQTAKPERIEESRAGDRGLRLVRALARTVRCTWCEGRVTVRAEFSSGAE
jgi:phage FluMu protein Com